MLLKIDVKNLTLFPSPSYAPKMIVMCSMIIILIIFILLSTFHVYTTRNSQLHIILKTGATYSKSHTSYIESFRTFTISSIPNSI